MALSAASEGSMSRTEAQKMRNWTSMRKAGDESNDMNGT